MTVTTSNLSPIETHGGMLTKREDLYRYDNGVNGSKLRACEVAMALAPEQHVVSAAACISPQNAIAASVAQRLGRQCTVIVGGTTPEKAMRHTSVRLAVEAGAQLRTIKVGYNPALQKAARETAEALGAWQIPYGLGCPPGLDPRKFYSKVGAQVDNLPADLETLIIPFGSGNTAAGVLYGLAQADRLDLPVKLIGIGPDKEEWLRALFKRMKVPLPTDMEIFKLHPWFAEYGDRMPARLGDIDCHPTYEGKVVTYLDSLSPEWWRVPTSLLWVVGGVLPKRKGDAS